ncbi:MAG: MFS transporter, partial [Candidatus Nanopelagicales bacterium]
MTTPGQRLGLYATVASLSRAASGGLPSAIILGVLAAGGSASDASLLVASVTAVAGLVGPLVGAAVDRLEQPRRGYLLAIIVLSATAAALAIGVGSWPPALLVLIAGGAGLAHPMFIGAWSAQVRRIAPEVPAARAYAVDAATYNIGDILGPALVGIAYVYDASTPGAASLEVVTVLYLCAGLAVLFVAIPHRDSTVPPEPLRHALRGLSIFWHSVALRRSTIISTVAFVGIAGVVISAPLLGQ